MKQRLIGVAVLIALVVIFLPMLFEPESVTRLSGSVVPAEPKWEFRSARPMGEEAGLPKGEPLPPGVPLAEGGSSGLAAAAPPLGGSGLAAARPAPVEAPARLSPPASQPPLAPPLGAGTRLAQESPGPMKAEPAPRPEAAPSAVPVAVSLSRAEPSPAADGAASKRPAPPAASTAGGTWHELTVKSGDNLYRLFARAGLPASQVKAVLRLGQATAGLSKLRPGQRFRLRVDDRRRLQELVYYRSRKPALHLLRGGAGLSVVDNNRVAAAAPAKPVGEVRETPRAKPKPKPGSAKVAASPRPGEPKGKGKKGSKHRAWVVQLASLGNKAKALKLRDRLRRGGYPAFLEPAYSGGNKVWRVRVGPELHKAKARTLRNRLEREFRLAGIVMAYP